MTEQQLSPLKKAIHDLGEHFESVQVFVSTHQPAEVGRNSACLSRGRELVCQIWTNPRVGNPNRGRNQVQRKE